jgi:DNA-binding transcriptional ArsR family regulator
MTTCDIGVSSAGILDKIHIRWRSALIWRNSDRASRPLALHLTFKLCKFKNMNVKEMIPASGKAAELLRSLSHRQRLLVLCALGRDEKTVAELRQELEIEQVPMSQQLMRLRADGLVEARREGTTVFYRITRPEVLTVVEALHGAFCPPSSKRA